MKYAGFWIRFVAWLIDYAVLSVMIFVLTFFFGIVIGLALGSSGDLSGGETIGVLNFLGFSLGIIVQWLYYAIMESSSKQATLGKMAVGIKVIDLEGNRISFGRATARSFAKILSGLIFCIGYFMIGWTREKQGLHDMIAGTLVIYNKQKE